MNHITDGPPLRHRNSVERSVASRLPFAPLRRCAVLTRPARSRIFAFTGATSHLQSATLTIAPRLSADTDMAILDLEINH